MPIYFKELLPDFTKKIVQFSKKHPKPGIAIWMVIVILSPVATSWSSSFVMAISKGGYMIYIIPVTGLFLMVILFLLGFETIKKSRRAIKYAFFTPWILVLFTTMFTLSKVFPPTHQLGNYIKRQLFGLLDPQPYWISDRQKQDFLSSINNKPLPIPPTPIIMAYASNHTGNSMGARKMEDLLSAAYPSNYVHSNDYKFQLSDRLGCKYRVICSEYCHTNKTLAAWKAADALLTALSHEGIDVDRGYNSHIKLDQIYVYVNRIDP